MKLRTALLLLTLLSCGIISCSHKDDHAKPSTQIIGKWNGDHLIEILSHDDQQVEADTVVITPPNSLVLEFKSDLTFSLDILSQGNSLQQSGVYSISGNKLFLGGQVAPTDDETFVVTIKGTSMELVGHSTETDNNIDYDVEEHIFLSKM